MRLWVRVKVNIYIVKMFFNCMEMMQTDKSESDVSTPLPAPVGALRTAKASTDTLPRYNALNAMSKFPQFI